MWLCTSTFGANCYGNTCRHTSLNTIQTFSQGQTLTAQYTIAISSIECVCVRVGVCECVFVCVYKLDWPVRVKQTHSAYSICFPCSQRKTHSERGCWQLMSKTIPASSFVFKTSGANNNYSMQPYYHRKYYTIHFSIRLFSLFPPCNQISL